MAAGPTRMAALLAGAGLAAAVLAPAAIARVGTGGAAPPVLVPLVSGSPAGGSGSGVGTPLDPQEVADVLAPMLGGGALGPGRTPAAVVDVATGQGLFSAADRATVPASTLKLATAVSALDGLGPDAVLTTRTVILDPDARTPRVVVIGAGDASLRSRGTRVGGAGTSLTPASMQQLAEATARALSIRGITTIRTGFDDSLFTGPALHPSWSRSFPGAGVVAPVSALQVDQGRRSPGGVARVSDPAEDAARTFAAQLEAAGVTVRGSPTRVRAREDSVALAAVESPTIAVLVERMVATSDNDLAESLGRLGALAAGMPASFAGVSERTLQLLDELGVPRTGARVLDASGLSRRNRLAPGTLTDLLGVVARGGFGPVSSGLPVAGATGSLRLRFTGPGQRAGLGLVRAKTGTLTGVAGLAGYVSRPDGRLLAFAFLDGSVTGGTLGARSVLDRAAAALASCDCAAP